MITVLHGENEIKSREKLVSLLAEIQSRGEKIVRLEGKKITLAQLEEALAQTDLFGKNETLVIEELHSLPRSKKKDELIAQVVNAPKDIILWEKRQLTPTMLKPFAGAKVEEYKLSNSLFSWLDLFHAQTPITKNLTALHTAVKSSGDHMCFLMLIRQIRLLIQVKDGGRPAGAPFMVQKLQKQAQFFTLEALLKIHTLLFELDRNMKSSQGFLSLEQELDLLVMNLYSDKA